MKYMKLKGHFHKKKKKTLDFEFCLTKKKRKGYYLRFIRICLFINKMKYKEF